MWNFFLAYLNQMPFCSGSGKDLLAAQARCIGIEEFSYSTLQLEFELAFLTGIIKFPQAEHINILDYLWGVEMVVT